MGVHERWQGGRGAALLVLVVLGVAANLATTTSVDCADDSPYTYVFAGDGQTGAATAPLGRGVSVTITCRAEGGTPASLPVVGVPAEWAVLAGGGLVDGADSRSKPTDWGGRSEVQWQLGPDLGEQVVSLRVRDRSVTFRAMAGGATSGGTCSGGAGTDFGDQERRIDGDETWPLAGSPYRGTAVSVAAPGRLTIEPGVTVCVGNLWLNGGAQLRAEGTAGQPIEMRAPPAQGGWTLSLLPAGGAAPDPARAHVMRHVNARDLGLMQVLGVGLRLEDSRLVAPVAGEGACALVSWSPQPAPGGDDAVLRSTFEGFGGSGCLAGNAAVELTAAASPASGPMPFSARVLRSQGHGVRLSGAAVAAFALSACEIADSRGDGLVVDAGGSGAIGTLNGCNLTGNAGFAVRNLRGAALPFDARGNWWGDPAGAPTAGGNAVSAGVDAGSAATAAIDLGY